jgi:hypothetical protein
VRVLQLQGPGDYAFVRVARALTMTIGSQCDLDFDQCDELRVAVDEACNTVIAAGAAEVAVDFVEEATLTVTIRPTRSIDLVLTPTSRLVLMSMVDDVAVQPDGSISLTKKLR